MIKVNSCQFNYQYSDQLHLPYSTAILVSYIKSIERLNNNFKFEKTFVVRKRIEENIRQCKDSDILLCSCYVWNWEITTHLAKEVKKQNPNCLIIFGGPQVPDDITGFFDEFLIFDRGLTPFVVFPMPIKRVAMGLLPLVIRWHCHYLIIQWM